MNDTKKRCLLFCECGAVCDKGGWQARVIPLPCFLAPFIYADVKVVEMVKMTCPNCLKLAPNKETT